MQPHPTRCWIFFCTSQTPTIRPFTFKTSRNRKFYQMHFILLGGAELWWDNPRAALDNSAPVCPILIVICLPHHDLVLKNFFNQLFYRSIMLMISMDQRLFSRLTSTSTWPKSWEFFSHSFGKWMPAAWQYPFFCRHKITVLSYQTAAGSAVVYGTAWLPGGTVQPPRNSWLGAWPSHVES